MSDYFGFLCQRAQQHHQQVIIKRHRTTESREAGCWGWVLSLPDSGFMQPISDSCGSEVITQSDMPPRSDLHFCADVLHTSHICNTSAKAHLKYCNRNNEHKQHGLFTIIIFLILKYHWKGKESKINKLHTSYKWYKMADKKFNVFCLFEWNS